MKMDRELAGAVLQRWQDGYPVAETALYKAASALGVDPQQALTEARFFTYVDSFLLEKRAMSGAERLVFAAAAGFSAGSMTKTASAHGLSPDDLIIEALRERNFVPDLEKIAGLFGEHIPRPEIPPDLGTRGFEAAKKLAPHVGRAVRGAGYVGGALYAGKTIKDHFSKEKEAMVAPPMDPSMGGGQAPDGAGGTDLSMDPAALQQAAGQAMMQPPQPGAAVQQQPSARVRPSPTAPEQVAPSDMGNLDELLAMSQQANPQGADAGGGVPPAGQPDAQPQPMDSLSRVMQVGPNLDQETAQRYAEQLDRFEQGFGMQISDPKQMVKFVKELQKVDGKKIDQGIKAMSQQLEQEQAQELGIDGGVPTIDGGGGPQVMAPKPGADQQPPGGAPQGGPPAGAPPPGGGGQDDAGPPGPQMAGGKPPGKMPPPQQKGPQQAAPQAAAEKVAHVARVLARAANAVR